MRATIHLAPHMMMGLMYTQGGPAVMIDAFKGGKYNRQAVVSIPVLMEGEAAAEEMFDLTNNPGRQGEREERYGFHRSVSVGDIIEVEEQPGLSTKWLCMSSGWKLVD